MVHFRTRATTCRASAASRLRTGRTWWDGAFATIYGAANLTHFEVWAYRVNPQEVSVGDPIDLSKQAGWQGSGAAELSGACAITGRGARHLCRFNVARKRVLEIYNLPLLTLKRRERRRGPQSLLYHKYLVQRAVVAGDNRAHANVAACEPALRRLQNKLKHMAAGGDDGIGVVRLQIVHSRIAPLGAM